MFIFKVPLQWISNSCIEFETLWVFAEMGRCWQCHLNNCASSGNPGAWFLLTFICCGIQREAENPVESSWELPVPQNIEEMQLQPTSSSLIASQKFSILKISATFWGMGSSTRGLHRAPTALNSTVDKDESKQSTWVAAGSMMVHVTLPPPPALPLELHRVESHDTPVWEPLYYCTRTVFHKFFLLIYHFTLSIYWKYRWK